MLYVKDCEALRCYNNQGHISPIDRHTHLWVAGPAKATLERVKLTGKLERGWEPNKPQAKPRWPAKRQTLLLYFLPTIQGQLTTPSVICPTT